MMTDESNGLQENGYRDDSYDEYSDESLFNISSWGADLTFRELVQMYEDGDLVKPEFQRNYVWKKSEASRFIESILLGLPVPSIFLANSKNNSRLIIDGFQRIMTVYYYMGVKKFARESQVFKLTNSERLNERWRNKAFEELSKEDQRKLRLSTIHAIIFEQKLPKNDDTSMFQIFSRINTSGRSLNAQEIRNCICQGELNALLFELNRNQTWRRLYGDAHEEVRMLDIELILRFFAIRELSRLESSPKQINLRKYLDVYMQSCGTEGMEQRKSDFVKMVEFVYARFGNGAFTSSTLRETESKSRINPIIFEAISVASDYYLHHMGETNAPEDLSARKGLLIEDAEFRDAAGSRTTNIDNIERRIRRAIDLLYPEIG